MSFDPRALILAIAPELRAAPLYVTKPPADYPALPGVRAFHSTFDLAIRADLKSRGEWIGPGNIIAICGEYDHEDLVGILLHEAAHALPFTEPGEDWEPSPEQVARQAEVITAWATEPESVYLAEPWAKHGPDFIRRAIHLHHRAASIGVSIPYPAMQAAGSHYRLSPCIKYARALGDEPARMDDASFTEIESKVPPQEFTDIFFNDVAAWRRCKIFSKE